MALIIGDSQINYLPLVIGDRQVKYLYQYIPNSSILNLS